MARKDERFDAGRDERWPTPPEQGDLERVMREANRPGAPPIDPVRERLGPNFAPTPFGYSLEEVTLGEQQEQAVMLVLVTVVGQLAVCMKPTEARDLGRALARYGGGLTVVDSP